ncbi:abortive infection Abi-like protein [Nitrosomonas oligotropha]|uniref:Abortive infection Abi-like protein n=1 Tax=Nitrosomonas oligotropha TaxID=42354 RepID=A0A2T5I0P4_9PROT|nr:abortive infection family protein [Nitrosomonas oligotropha]PTQ77417.1 abortive infection Abi-like protein [Nitrosomonas oligotropha]
MSDLSSIEKKKLERALGMSSGYVLQFSNRTFEDFFAEICGVEIYDEKYNFNSGSKANRMRAFWEIESNYLVSRILIALREEWSEYAGYSALPPPEDFNKIIQRLSSSIPVPEINAIRPNSDDKDFESLAKAVRESIERNEPEAGLDRLHTFLIKYFRTLCEKHKLDTSRDKPLHSLVGEYMKVIKTKGLIESEITERILKSTISIMEAFNTIRNEHSFAHVNKVLNYNESLLIFSHVTSSVRFIETIESAKVENTPLPVFDDEIPF